MLRSHSVWHSQETRHSTCRLVKGFAPSLPSGKPISDLCYENIPHAQCSYVKRTTELCFALAFLSARRMLLTMHCNFDCNH